MKALEDQTEVELNETIKAVCAAISAKLPPNTGFIVLASTFGGKIAQYGSNVHRDDAAKWMMETVSRWGHGDFVHRSGPRQS